MSAGAPEVSQKVSAPGHPRSEKRSLAPVGPTIRFFVYGTMLSGEPHHDRLGGASCSGVARTRPSYSLVEMNALAALVPGGTESVVGEVYALTPEQLREIGAQRHHPGLYRVGPVGLEDGTTAEAYLLEPDQVRGKRKIQGGDWRARFAARNKPDAGPFVRWARTRPR